MASPIGALRVLLSATSAQFEKDLGVARRSLGSMGPALAKVAKVAAVAGAAITAALAAIVKSTANTGDAIAKTSAKIGISVEALSELRHAADLSGLKIQTLEMALQRFTRRSAEAAMGTGEAKAALAELGIQLRDSAGRLRPTEDLLGDVADAFQGVESQSDRVRLAFKLFDSEGVAMVNMLGRGKAGLEAMRAEARRLGIVWTGEAAKAAEAFNDNLTRMGKALTGLKETIGKALLPTLVTLTDNLVAFAKSDEFRLWVQDVGNNLRDLAVPMILAAARGFLVLAAATNRSIQAVRGWINLWDRFTLLQLEFKLAMEKLGGAGRREVLELEKQLAETKLAIIESADAFFAHDEAADRLWAQLAALEKQLTQTGGATAKLNVEGQGAAATAKATGEAMKAWGAHVKSVDETMAAFWSRLADGLVKSHGMTKEVALVWAQWATHIQSVNDTMAAFWRNQANQKPDTSAFDEWGAHVSQVDDTFKQFWSDQADRMAADRANWTAHSTIWADLAARAASAWASIGSAFSSTIVGMIQGTATFGQFFISVLSSMLNAVVGFVVQTIANWVEAAASKTAADSTMLTVHTATETAMTAVTAEAELARASIVALASKAALASAGASLAGIAATGAAAMAVMAAVGAAMVAVLTGIAAALTATVVGAGFAAGYAAAATAVGTATTAAVGTGTAAIATAVGAAAGTIAGALATPLATGGIVTAPTLAMIGEGREAEVVSPLSQLGKFLPDVGDGVQRIFVVLDERVIAKAMVRGMPREIRVQAGVRA